MSGNSIPVSSVPSRPEILLPDGNFAIVNGTEYLAMVWGDGSATVLVNPSQKPPESGFRTDPSDWSRKVYPEGKLDRTFRRNTNIVWKNCLWYVPRIYPDQLRFECRLLTGYTPIATLAQDSRTERGDEPTELWAHLTLDDVDAVAIDETEIINGVKDESTKRRIYTWRRPIRE